MDSVVDIQFVKVKVKPKTCNMEWVLAYYLDAGMECNTDR